MCEARVSTSFENIVIESCAMQIQESAAVK